MISSSFSKTYDHRPVLRMPEMVWEPGKIYAVIGANGSGKSTLAKILAGILKPDQNRSPISGARIGYLPQKPYAFRMSTEKNLYLNGTDCKRAEQLLTVLGLESLRKKQAHRLSGGETAKLALARLLMRDYALLILDEPTAAMDMESTLVSENLIRNYQDETQCAVIIITHNLQQARRIADRILYLEMGELVEAGEKTEFLQNPKRTETKRFLQFFGFDSLS